MIGDRDHQIGALHLSLGEHVVAGAVAHQGHHVVVILDELDGVRGGVDRDEVVPLVLHGAEQVTAHLAHADDDDVHQTLTSSERSPRRSPVSTKSPRRTRGAMRSLKKTEKRMAQYARSTAGPS